MATYRILTLDELQWIFAEVDVAATEGVAVALLAMKFRASEIARLRRGDVAEDAGGTVVKVGEVCMRPPQFLAAALRSLAAKGDPKGSLLGLSAAQVRWALQSVAERAGMQGVTVRRFQGSLAAYSGSRLQARSPHIARHLAKLRAVWEDRMQPNLSSADVRRLLGHAQVKSTERYLAPWQHRDR